MQRATLRYTLIGLAVVLGMGLAGYAVASTFKEPGSSDLGPSIVFTPSPAASEPRKSAPDQGAGPVPEPKETSAPPKPAPDKTAATSPPAPAPVPVQPAPPVEYDNDDEDDDAAEPDEDDDGIDD
ncbi:hypothetical protein [Arthrobacter mangrovi]|uniref:Uncharacterized protein n=1 Tax=Arthrobacter mangrovi TaxID=2966350 RepID=A0ABQ5MSW1_9MICC|nr:hypothetical protein [Arthrobacter mangrovi]GLB67049.1 hypothetical protein AHIS1636_14880 [Arthrobacter mangrovi]